MGTFLSSKLLVAVLIQAPGMPSASADSAAALWARVARDSTDAPAWFALGRTYVRLATAYHRHAAAPDTSWARAALDTADRAFVSAAALAPATPEGDSARTYRVFVWAEKAFLAWEQDGIEAAAESWHGIPEDLRLLPVLQELGENLLRACPREGVLLTAGDVDTYSAWYMRFARGLRTDLLILPYVIWVSDSVFRNRLAGELKLPRPPREGRGEATPLRALAQQRPVCASMDFERPPEPRARMRWAMRPLVWVTGPGGGGDRVPPQDFVFAAVRLALDTRESWAGPVLALYRRAAAATPGLCEPLATFGVKEEAGCRR
ncbi:MAG: hypothetical protein HYS40_00210 [Gemmatimonadetes bacterium]|nr:hypothetical protein [Gemmatimonadota bacterium]